MPEHITEPHGGEDSAQGSPHFVLESPALLQAVDDTEASGNAVNDLLDELDSLDDVPVRDGGESSSADVRAAVPKKGPDRSPMLNFDIMYKLETKQEEQDCQEQELYAMRDKGPDYADNPELFAFDAKRQEMYAKLLKEVDEEKERRSAVGQQQQHLPQEQVQVAPVPQLQQPAQSPPQSMQHLGAGGAISSSSSQDIAAVPAAATTMETAGTAPATAGTSLAPAGASRADVARATKKRSAASSTKDRAPSPEAGPFDDDEMSEVSSLVESAIFLGDFEPSPRESDSPAGTSNPVAYTSEEVQSAVTADAEGATETADVKIASLNKQYESSPTDEGDVKPS